MALDVKGFEDMIKNLTELGAKGERKINSSLKKGGEVILSEAQNRVPVDEGKLRNALRVSNVRQDVDGSRYIAIGTLANSRKDAYYAHIVENGHLLVDKTGKTYGNVPARPFMKPAFQTKQKEALDVIAEEMRKGLGL